MNILSRISDALWGLPTALLILGVGLSLSLRTGFLQIRRFGEILKSPISGEKRSRSAVLRSMSTALAATVGTGSVVGVGSAIAIGGPGAVFWLIVSAFFGMPVAYAEGVLSVKYRQENPRAGGIWFALRDGLKMPKIAKLYAFFCIFSSFGMGCMTQTSAASEALNDGFSIPPALTGGILASLLFICLFSHDFTGKICEAIVPFFAGFYIIGALSVIIMNHEALSGVFKEIFTSAFGMKQAAGGFTGGFFIAISTGFRRGVFSNEAGLGTTAPVHALSDNDDPDRQGLMNMLEVMIDTFVICVLTAFAILSSGADKITSGGAEAVLTAAETVFGSCARQLVALSIAAFSIATAIGWSRIGLSAAEFFSPKIITLYRLIYAFCGLFGTLFALEEVLCLSDIFNALMVFPCVGCIILLSGEVVAAMRGRDRAE